MPPSTPRAPLALTRPLLWPPARPPGPDPRPAPLCSHHPSAPQGPQLPSPGAQSLQTHPGGVPVSSPPVQSGCSQGPSESKQTLWSASAAPGRPPACPRERRRYGLHSHVTLVGGEVLFLSTWWGGGRGSLTRQHLRLSRQGFGGAGVNRRLWGEASGVRVRAEGSHGGLGRAPWPPTPGLWGDGRTHCRLGQTGGRSVLRSIKTVAPPAWAVRRMLSSGGRFPSSHSPSSRRRQEGSCSPLTLWAGGLSAGPGGEVGPPGDLPSVRRNHACSDAVRTVPGVHLRAPACCRPPARHPTT